MSAKIIIEIRKDRLLAAWGGRKGGWIDQAIPEDLSGESRRERIASLLKDGGAPTGKSVLVVPRREVVLLRLSLGAPDGASESDLHSIARLNLGEHSTLDPQQCELDVLPSGGDRHVVCAAPAGVIEEARKEAKSIGCPAHIVSTRSAGLAQAVPAEGSHLVVVAGTREVEIAIIHEGVPVLARQLNRNGNATSDIDKIVAEVHRCASSASVVAGLRQIRSGYLHAHADIREELATKLTRQEGYNFRPVPGEHDPKLLEALPLMLLASSKEAPVISLRRVRPPTGLALPKVRIAAGLAALVLIVVIGGWIVLSGERSKLRGQVNSLRSELMQLQSKERAHLREEARLIHLKSFMDEDPTWTSHLAAINDLLPEDGLIVNRIAGAAERGVGFSASRDSSGRRYAGGRWSLNEQVSFDLQASVSEREMVPTFRQRLIDDPRFEVESKGPELPDRLAFKLTSTMDAASESDKSEEGDAE